MYSNLPMAGGSAPGAKMAIPRLERPDATAASRKDKDREQRVAKACINCRKRKVKCSGELPRCLHCEASDLKCVYEAARRDRLRSATTRNQTLVTLLKDLSLRVDEADQMRIREALDNIADDLPERAHEPLLHGKRRKPHSDSEEEPSHAAGKESRAARMGSSKDLDQLDEDLLTSREAMGVGFVGQNSEVQWLRSLRTAMAPGEEAITFGLPHEANGADAPHRRRLPREAAFRPVSEASFYLDNDDVQLDIMVDPYERPAPEAAERLFKCYIDTVHASFPIIPQAFVDQFRRYNEAQRSDRPFMVPDKWLAILNLVLAIGSRYSQLIHAEWQGDVRHDIYMTRAVRLLGIKDAMLIISAPDLGNIQATGLMSFYYLVIGHVSRAWVMIGVAIRLALALGLHLRNEDTSTPAGKRDTLIRTWWSLHSIECLLNTITGRPCVLSNEDCTVPLLSEYMDEVRRRRSDPGGSRSRRTSQADSPSDRMRIPREPPTYIDFHVGIGIITQRVLNGLYSPRTASHSWRKVQEVIEDLLKQLHSWETKALPAEASTHQVVKQVRRNRLLLSFHYTSTKILITRPCLCRFPPESVHDRDETTAFTEHAADLCVQAAQSLAGLLPENSDVVSLYETGPWWSVVHSIMQAVAVLLLKISYQSPQTIAASSTLTVCIKKLIRWLRLLKSHDAVAERAYRIVEIILRDSRSCFRAEADDLLASSEIAPSAAATTLLSSLPAPPPALGSMNALPTGFVPSSQYLPVGSLPPKYGQAAVDPLLLHDPGMPTQTEPFPFSFMHSANAYTMSNPFSTEYDEHHPFQQFFSGSTGPDHDGRGADGCG